MRLRACCAEASARLAPAKASRCAGSRCS